MRHEIRLQIYMDPAMEIHIGYLLKAGETWKDFEGAYVNLHSYEEIKEIPEILADLAKEAYAHLKRLLPDGKLFHGIVKEETA